MSRTLSGRAFCCLAVVVFSSCENPAETNEINVNQPIPTSLAPVAVSGNFTFVSIAAAAQHTCALATDGVAYCWGGDDGHGYLTPTPVPGSATFTAVTPNCGLTTAGEVYCWYVPWHDSLPFRLPGDVRVTSISGGQQSLCGLNTEGIAWCWDYAAAPWPLEDGLRLTVVDVSRSMTQLWGDHICGLTLEGTVYCWRPIDGLRVPGDLRFSSLSTGESYACGISGGSAYCWGSNSRGQLGDGFTTSGSLAPLPVSGSVGFTSISSGLEHTCALTEAGEAYCWGRNHYNQLGRRSEARCEVQGSGYLGARSGWTPCSGAPAPVATDLRFSVVSAGAHHTCGLTAAGEAYCWGKRALLGDGRRQ